MTTAQTTLSPKAVATVKHFLTTISGKIRPTEANYATLYRGLLNQQGFSLEDVLAGNFTSDDLRISLNANVDKIDWLEKPAKLKGVEAAKNGLQGFVQDKDATKDLATKRAENEARIAKEDADAKNFKLCDEAIQAYYPTTRFGSLAEGTQRAERKRLSEWVASIKGKFPSAEILKALKAEIEKLYAAEAKSRERV
jgi:hypothetical protein